MVPSQVTQVDNTFSDKPPGVLEQVHHVHVELLDDSEVIEAAAVVARPSTLVRTKLRPAALEVVALQRMARLANENKQAAMSPQQLSREHSEMGTAIQAGELNMINKLSKTRVEVRTTSHRHDTNMNVT